jgi:hypothetical protein
MAPRLETEKQNCEGVERIETDEIKDGEGLEDKRGSVSVVFLRARKEAGETRPRGSFTAVLFVATRLGWHTSRTGSGRSRKAM